MRVIALTLSILILPAVASAHHSRAEFAAEVQEIEGELVEIAWRNPHPVLTLKVVNDAGEEELWNVEGWQSANSLLRKGVTADVFTVGDRVRAAVQVSNRRAGLLLGTSISLGNGTQAVLRPGYEPFWADETVIGSDASTGLTNGPANSTDNTQYHGLFRVWTFKNRTGVPDLPLTAAALQKTAAFDELADHPLWNCDAVGMPVAMDTGLPIEFVDSGDQIVMRIEQNDNTRIIHLNSAAAEAAATAMGHSVGEWEGDTLVVTTTNSNYPYFDDDGTPKSENMIIVERFRISEDERSLSWEAEMTDPEYFSEAVTIRANWDWVPGERIEPWNCAVSG
ncbi:MAG: DUF6152 family protein [Gammaproteobacteria bacterium]